MMKALFKTSILLLLCLFCSGTLRAQGQHWQCDPYAWEYDMTAYVTLTLNDKAVNNLSDFEIAAFCGTECRGVANIQSTEKDGQTAIYAYLRIRSNQQSAETITFKVYDKVSEKEYDVEDYSVIFQSQGVVGLPSDPVQFSVLDDCNISVSSSDVTKGSAEGSVTVKYEAEVTVTATANEGYHFVNWTVDDVSVSTDAIYTFAAKGDISLVANFAPNQIMVTYQLHQSGAGTLLLPFDAEVPTGLQVFTVEGIVDNVLTLAQQDNIAAGTPLIVLGPGGDEYTFTGVPTITETQVGDGLLVGTIVNTSVTAGYVLQTQANLTGFYHIDAGKTIQLAAYHCWLNYDGNANVIQFNEMLDGINGVKANVVPAFGCYDLQGWRCEVIRTGMYIINGKKVFIKR